MDGGWSLVGDLGDVLEPLDVLEEGEELSVGDRIEYEQTFSLCGSAQRGSAAAATIGAGNSALQTYY